MKKLDGLLKRVEFYERLAIYGDRGSFLRALAQISPFTKEFGERTRQQLQSVMSDVEFLNIKEPNALSVISNALDSHSPLDKGALVNVLESILSKYPPNHDSQKQNLQDLLSKLKGSPAQAENETMNMPTDHITGYAPIPKDIQQMLSELVTTEGLGLPIKVDGKIGKETRSAMNAFKKKFMNGQGTDQQVFAKIKEMSQSGGAETPINLDDAAKQREEYYRSQSIPPGMPGSRT